MQYLQNTGALSILGVSTEKLMHLTIELKVMTIISNKFEHALTSIGIPCKHSMYYLLNVIPSNFICIAKMCCYYQKTNAFIPRNEGNDHNL